MPVPAGTELPGVLDRAWTLLEAAVAARVAPLRWLTVATAGPDVRTMVLRRVDRVAACLDVYTDARAPKVAVIAGDARVAVLGYDSGLRLQLRIHGSAAVATRGAAVDAAFAALRSRADYASVPIPGTTVEAPALPLDESFARANFAVVTITLDRIESLDLAIPGFRRAAFARDCGWSGIWLAP